MGPLQLVGQGSSEGEALEEVVGSQVEEQKAAWSPESQIALPRDAASAS